MILIVIFQLLLIIILSSTSPSSSASSSISDAYKYLVKLDYYETENTKYAIDPDWSQVTKVTICQDSPLFVASNCVSGINEYQCKGNQMIKLFSKDFDEWKLEKIGKYKFCGTCAELEFEYSITKYGYGCKDFYVFAGCYGDEKCSGQLTLEGTAHPTSQPTAQPSPKPTRYHHYYHHYLYLIIIIIITIIGSQRGIITTIIIIIIYILLLSHHYH